MTFDLENDDRPLAYKLLASLVTPRPIALVSTASPDGIPNAAPFSFFNVLGSRPPIVGVCPGNREPGVPKDTARNIRLTQAFVVNLVDERLAGAMNLCSAELPAGESEFSHASLSPVPGDRVTAPRIAEAPVSLECREWGTLEIGLNRLVIGEVLLVHVREGVIDPETKRLVPGAYQPVGRMHGADGYCRTRDQFSMPRP